MPGTAPPRALLRRVEALTLTTKPLMSTHPQTKWLTASTGPQANRPQPYTLSQQPGKPNSSKARTREVDDCINRLDGKGGAQLGLVADVRLRGQGRGSPGSEH